MPKNLKEITHRVFFNYFDNYPYAKITDMKIEEKMAKLEAASARLLHWKSFLLLFFCFSSKILCFMISKAFGFRLTATLNEKNTLYYSNCEK